MYMKSMFALTTLGQITALTSMVYVTSYAKGEQLIKRNKWIIYIILGSIILATFIFETLFVIYDWK